MATTTRPRKSRTTQSKSDDLFGLSDGSSSKKSTRKTRTAAPVNFDARFKSLRDEIEERFDRLRSTMKDGFSDVAEAVKPAMQKERFADLEDRLKGLKSDIRDGFSDAEKSAKSLAQKSHFQDLDEKLKLVRQDIQSGFEAQTKALKASSGSQAISTLEDSIAGLRREIRDGFETQAKSLKAGGQAMTYEMEERVKTVRAIPADLSGNTEASISALGAQGRRHFTIAMTASLLLAILMVAGLFVLPKLSAERVDEAVQGVIPVVKQQVSNKIDSTLIPLKASIDQSFEAYNHQLVTDRNYAQVMEAGVDAQNGSRAGLERLLRFGASGGEVGKRATDRVSSLRKSYEILRAPDMNALQLSNLAPFKNGDRVPLSSLSTPELVSLLVRPGLSLYGVHEVMSQLWTRPASETRDEFAKILKSSDNLPAVAAVSSVVAHQRGMRGDLFDFRKWEAAVKKM